MSVDKCCFVWAQTVSAIHRLVFCAMLFSPSPPLSLSQAVSFIALNSVIKRVSAPGVKGKWIPTYPGLHSAPSRADTSSHPQRGVWSSLSHSSFHPKADFVKAALDLTGQNQCGELFERRAEGQYLLPVFSKQRHTIAIMSSSPSITDYCRIMCHLVSVSVSSEWS